jgi:hypothetical protein
MSVVDGLTTVDSNHTLVMWGGKFSIENFSVRKIFQKIFRFLKSSLNISFFSLFLVTLGLGGFKSCMCSYLTVAVCCVSRCNNLSQVSACSYAVSWAWLMSTRVRVTKLSCVIPRHHHIWGLPLSFFIVHSELTCQFQYFITSAKFYIILCAVHDSVNCVVWLISR